MSSASHIKPKRQTVKNACASCQKRKVKCSGERPACTLCASKGQTCTYDAEAGLTRVEALRRKNKELAEQNADYEAVFNTLRNAPELEAVNHLLRLRAASDVESYAASLKHDQDRFKRRPSSVRASSPGTAISSTLSQKSSQDHDMDGTKPIAEASRGVERLRSVFADTLSRPATAVSQAPEIDSKIQSMRDQRSSMDHSFSNLYPTSSRVEAWPYQGVPPENIAMLPPASQTAANFGQRMQQGYQESEAGIQTQNWLASFDTPRQAVDPALIGSQTWPPLAEFPMSQETLATDGENQQSWNPWTASWSQPSWSYQGPHQGSHQGSHQGP